MKKLLLVVLTLAACSPIANAQSPTPTGTDSASDMTPAENATPFAPPAPPAPAVAPALARPTPTPRSFETKIEILGHNLAKLDDSHVRNRPPKSGLEDLAEVVVPSIFFLTVIAIVAGGYIFRYRQKVLLHQTVRAMVEKGLEVPPALLDPQGRPKTPRSDLRRGIVLIGVGIGVSVFFALLHTSAWGLGLIPLCIGIGYIVVWKLETKDSSPR